MHINTRVHLRCYHVLGCYGDVNVYGWTHLSETHV